MIVPSSAEAEAHASAAIGAVMQQAAEQAPHSSSAAHAALRPPEAAQGLPACAFAFPPLHAGRAQTAVRHERLPPPLVLPTCEVGLYPLHHLRAVHALRCKLHTAHLYIMQAFTRSWVAKLPQPVRIHAMQFEAQAICLITPQIAITYACAGWRKCLSAGSPGAGAAAAAAASAAH